MTRWGEGADTVRVALGTAEAVAPEALAALENGRRGDSVTVRVHRVLGVRQIVQGAATAAAGSAGARRIGAVVDVLHAASMVLLAVLDPGRRRAALVQAATAGCFAAIGAAAARSAER